jgi:centrosomal protein CEP164
VIVPKAGETYVSEDGTVSQVLDDHIDANYEPTEEEVLEFADWIGMKLPEDSEYLWLAREGLKTPLPKEWKPCSTNDGEVYYFNFKTGESSWDHPMDSLFRQRFEQEKEKARKDGKPAAPAAAAAKASVAATASNPNKGGSGASTSNPVVVIPQTRVIMTDAGVTWRDTGSAAGSFAPSTSTGGPSSGSRGAAERGVKADKYTNSDLRSSATASSRASPLAGSTSSVGFISGGGGGGGGASQSSTNNKVGSQPAVSSSTATPVLAASLAAPKRFVSEAERAMEERVQREVQRALEMEKAKVAESHQGTLASLRQLHEKDMADMRASVEARRAATAKQEDEERERRLQQTREKCEELYGDELRTMEREEETLKNRLQKMEAEAARAANGNTQRAQIEEQMQKAFAKQRTDLEATLKRQHDAAVAAEGAAHTAAMQKIARDSQEKVSAVKQTALRKMDAAERAMALEVETQKKRLEDQLKNFERQLSEAAKASNKNESGITAGAAASTSSPSLSGELARISSTKAARLRELENEAQKEREAARVKGEAALAEVTRQLQQQSVSTAGLLSTPTSRVPSASGERPMSVTVQGGAGGGSFAGSRPGSATLSVAYTQELNRIRMVRAKERQERLAQLRVERDAAIAAVSISPAPSLGASDRAASSVRSDSDALNLSTLEELKAAHAEELEAKKTLYARLEAELKEQLSKEAFCAAAATTAEQQSALVAKAVDAEMELYTQEVLARHARMQLEADAKREKLLTDHQLALEAHERKKKEAEARQAREEQEAQEAFIQEKVDAAVQAETAKLEAEHATAMARLTARYDEERDAAKGEVDEEMDAYEQAERQKIVAAAASAMPAVVVTQPAPKALQLNSTSSKTSDADPPDSDSSAVAGVTAEIEARCTEVTQKLKEREARWTADKRRLDEQRETLETKRITLLVQKQQHQQNLEILKEDNAALSTALTAAEARREEARKATPAAAQTPQQSPTISTPAALEAPPVGHRVRAVHEAAMRAMEDGYRTEQSVLESDLQSWRSKVQQLLRDQQARRATLASSTITPANLGGCGNGSGITNTVNTGLNTPRQQVLSYPGSAGAAATTAMAGSVHRTPVLSHPSPIAATAPGASLQNTPLFSIPFGDSPWVQLQQQQQQRSTTPPKAVLSGVPFYCGGPTASGLGPSVERSLLSAPNTSTATTAAFGRDALSFSREERQGVLQRQASLQAARDAWQQERARELRLQVMQRQQQQQQQQLQQRGMRLPSPSSATTASFAQPGGYSGFEAEGSRPRGVLAPERQPSPHPQDQLSVVLSKLSSRLDSLTGQAEQLQRRYSSRGEHVDPHSMRTAKDTGGALPVSRSHSSHSRHHRPASPQRQPAASVTHNLQQSKSANTSLSVAQRKIPRSPNANRRASSRHGDDTLSSKWNQLLGGYGRQ